jgi:hypothetical protein
MLAARIILVEVSASLGVLSAGSRVGRHATGAESRWNRHPSASKVLGATKALPARPDQTLVAASEAIQVDVGGAYVRGSLPDEGGSLGRGSFSFLPLPSSISGSASVVKTGHSQSWNRHGPA